MFGLMRSRSCGQAPEERLRRRFHYCGMCKTLGRMYGQRTRIVLDFDAVFAAELLTALSNGDRVEDWNAAYHSQSCVRLPVVDELRPELRYAAAVNVLLAEVTLDDRIADSGNRAWPLAKRPFAKAFRRAAAHLAAVGFPVEALRRAVGRQKGVEARLALLRGASPQRVLEEAAAPTAEATALAFGFGALVAGRPTARDDLEELGSAFGSLIYTLDALRDVAADARAGAFNAIRAAYGFEGDRVPIPVRRDVEVAIRALAGRADSALRRLPISGERAAIFSDRLNGNLARLGVARRLRVLGGSEAPHACARATLADRRAAAMAVARSVLASRATACRPVPAKWVEAPFVLVLGAVAGFLSPHLAVGTPSVNDCADQVLNLAAVGSAVAAMAGPPPLPPGPIDPTRPRPRAGEAGASGSDASGWCDMCDCDGCCDISDCCSGGGSCGSCDGCDCCGSCGDCGSCCDCSCDC